MTQGPVGAILFYGLVAVWVGSEAWLDWRRRSADPTRRRDRGTLALLHVTIYLSIALAVYVSIAGIAPYPPAWRPPLFWLGLALMAAGITFRWWAIRVLAQFFTVDVSIREDHRLVRDGPYRWLRHPSYTGALATFYGLALALGSWLSALLIVVPVTLVFLRRMRVEEQALAEACPARLGLQPRSAWRRRTSRPTAARPPSISA